MCTPAANVLPVALFSAVLCVFMLSCGGVSEKETGTPGKLSKRDMERFRSVTYVTHVENDPKPEERGVSFYDVDLASPGLNLLTSNEVGGSHLLDMNGNVLHS